MKTSVIIVTYNSEKEIKNCVRSLKKFKDLEIIVVDNNSKDETLKIIEEEFPEVILIKNKKNLGFAKACNLGSKISKGEFLFFLNPDTEILEGNLNEFVKFLEERKDIGILGPKLVFPDRKLQRSYFPELNLCGIFLKLFYLEKFFMKHFNDREKEVDMLTGAAILLRREDFFKIGGFDENFPLYFEDFDLARRMHKYGKKIYFYPDLVIIHYGGASAKLDLFSSRRLGRKSLNYYVRKYYGRIGMIFFMYMLFFRFLINKFILKLSYLLFKKPGNFFILDKNTSLWLSEFFF